MMNLLKIKQLRKVLTQEAAHILVRGLVISHLDYGNSMFAGLPACRINLLRMQQQNWCWVGPSMPVQLVPYNIYIGYQYT